MWQHKILIFIFVILLLVQTSCSERKGEFSENIVNDMVVGFSIYSTHDDYTEGVVEAFSEIMDNEGINYIIKDANGDTKKQISDVENLVAEKVDIIGILPMDEKAIRNSLDEAYKRNIPIVSITRIPWVNVAATISGADYANGKGAGKVMRDKLGGKGNIVLLNYSYDISRVDERLNGFMDAIKASDIEVIETKRTATTEETMDTVKNLIETYPELDGIFASVSNQVIGCGAVLKALDKKDIVITGIGSEMNVIDMILDGYITAVAARFPKEHGRLTAEAIIKLLRNQTYEKNYEVSFQIIDKSNAIKMAEILYDKELK